MYLNINLPRLFTHFNSTCAKTCFRKMFNRSELLTVPFVVARVDFRGCLSKYNKTINKYLRCTRINAFLFA